MRLLEIRNFFIFCDEINSFTSAYLKGKSFFRSLFFSQIKLSEQKINTNIKQYARFSAYLFPFVCLLELLCCNTIVKLIVYNLIDFFP